MMLGVGLHFLPRLRGRSLAHEEHTRTVPGLLVPGLTLRMIAQSLLVLGTPASAAPVIAANLVLADILEPAGITVDLGLLMPTLRAEQPLRSRPGVLPVQAFLGVAFGSFWLAPAANLVAIGAAASAGSGGRWAQPTIPGGCGPLRLPGADLDRHGARLFPLHFAAQLPSVRLFMMGLAFLLVSRRGAALRRQREAGSAESRVVRSVGASRPKELLAATRSTAAANSGRA